MITQRRRYELILWVKLLSAVNTGQFKQNYQIHMDKKLDKKLCGHKIIRTINQLNCSQWEFRIVTNQPRRNLEKVKCNRSIYFPEPVISDYLSADISICSPPSHPMTLITSCNVYV